MDSGLIVIGSFAVLFVGALVYGVIEHRRDLKKGINIVVGHMSMEEYNFFCLYASLMWLKEKLK